VGILIRHSAKDAVADKNVGFFRTKIRAETNAGFLCRTGKEPPFFWNEVDAVTVKIAAMLLPLYNVVDDAWPTRNTRFEQFYQLLHQIVSHAGWIQVYTSQCTSIIEFQWLQPGDDCRLGQVNICHESYELSRDNAEKDDENLGRDANDRLGRIKISISPQISQHLSNEPEGSRTWRAASLLRPYVVYYHGRMDRREDSVAAVGLPSYISNLHKSCESSEPPKAAPTWPLWLGLIAVVGILIMIFGQAIRTHPFGQLENQHSHLATELQQVHEIRSVSMKFAPALLSSAHSNDLLEGEYSASPIDRPLVNLST
jgi:hypothetical protein